MAEARFQRRLAAILAAEVGAYSRLMGADENGTRVRLRSVHSDLIDPRMAADGGSSAASLRNTLNRNWLLGSDSLE